jgi:hypothetical protein
MVLQTQPFKQHCYRPSFPSGLFRKLRSGSVVQEYTTPEQKVLYLWDAELHSEIVTQKGEVTPGFI